jgi:hypothetical protein
MPERGERLILYLVVVRLQRELNSVAWVLQRTIPTEGPPLVSEVSANFLRIEGAILSAWRSWMLKGGRLRPLPTCVHGLFPN